MNRLFVLLTSNVLRLLFLHSVKLNHPERRGVNTRRITGGGGVGKNIYWACQSERVRNSIQGALLRGATLTNTGRVRTRVRLDAPSCGSVGEKTRSRDQRGAAFSRKVVTTRSAANVGYVTTRSGVNVGVRLFTHAVTITGRLPVLQLSS